MNIIIALACFLFIGNIKSELAPIQVGLKPNVFDVFIPTVRQTLDDCSTRYYRYGIEHMDGVTLGTPVKLSEFSHFVAIGWTQSDKTIFWSCGGSLISDNFVLTAAHCTSFKSIQPDKALLGDRFPNTTADDEFAQQFNIVEAIPHERYRATLRYFDIGLIRLERNIIPHETVLPACLWNLNTISEFKTLEAIGIGQMEFGQDRRNGLQKVALDLIDTKECQEFHNEDSDRRLKNGLVDHQLCARGDRSGDLRQDTCTGDSGGPLQVKLLANGRMTAYIVGITSFGTYCGGDTPGVYTKVAPFNDWIEEKIKISFDPRHCALRHVSVRNFQPGLIDYEIPFGDPNDPLRQAPINEFFSKIHISVENRHKAYLGKYRRDDIDWYCGATLISEKWLITTAQCAGQKPDIVSVGGVRPFGPPEDMINQKREIEELVMHPSYRGTELYHDIALIKMKEAVTLSLSVVPVCIWKSHELPTTLFEVFGWGSRYSNIFFLDNDSRGEEDDEIFPIFLNECDVECQVNTTKALVHYIDHPKLDEVRYLEINTTILENQICDEYYYRYNQSEIVNHQICFQTDFFVVPGICDLDIGGQVGRKVFGYNGFDQFIFGISSYGNNCGFGTPFVATRVSSYADWIEKIILDVTDNTNDQRDDEKIPVNQNRKSEKCTSPDVCTTLENCPELAAEYKFKDNSVIFCAVQPKPMICCPPSYVLHIDGNENIRTCALQYHELRRNTNSSSKYENNKIFTHTAAIGFLNNEDIEYKCWGALINKRFVVTTASCLTIVGSAPIEVRLGNQNFELATEKYTERVSNVIIHPWYRSDSHYYDIALLCLKKSVIFDRNIAPACIWLAEDVIPFIGIVPGPFNVSGIKYACTSSGEEKCEANNETEREKPLLSMQRDQCELYYKLDNSLPKGIIPSQICAQSEIFNMTDSCIETPGALYQKGIEVNGVIIPYIVGLYSFDYGCHLDKPAVFTRISSFVDFIEDHLNS